MNTFVAFVVVIGVLVLVHELGHFLVARAVGVRVETFSIGFGPQIAAFQRGETTYRVALVPLGGYVKMAGEEPDDPEAAAPDSYAAKPRWQRALIVLAGPTMNLLLAYLLAPVVYMVGVPEPAYLDGPPIVGWIEELPPERRDPLLGARIERVDGQPVTNWRELLEALGTRSGSVRLELLLRSGTTTQVTLTAAEPGELLRRILPPTPPVVDRVLPDGAAARAGIKAGDRIVAIDGKPVRHWFELRHRLDEVGLRPVEVVVRRGETLVTFLVKPLPNPRDGRPMLGVARRDGTVVHRYGLGEALRHGVERVNGMIGLTFRVIGDLFSGRLGLDALGGPVMIAQGAGEAARAGLGAFLTFLIFISVQLGILNLLPIPVLDGGHLVLLGLEAVTGGRIPDRWVAWAQWLGLGLLIALMLYVTRNDLVRLWGDVFTR